GVIPEEYYVHYTNDRVSTMSTVWMGVSMGCVTCHEHKFDPFEMKDFYQLFAFFNSLDGPVMDGNKKDTAPVLRVASDQQQAELDELAGRIAELVKSMEAPQEQVDQAQRAWEVETLRGLESQPQWAVLAAASLNSRGGAKLEQQEDRSVLASGDNPDKEVYTLETELESGDLTALRLEVLLHDSFGGRAGRSSNGNAVLSEFEAEVATADSPDKWQPLKFSKAWADYEQPDGNFKIANAIDGQPGTGWAIAGHQKKEAREAIFVAEKPFGAKGSRLRIRLRHESIYGQHQFGRFRMSVTSAEQLPAIGATSVPAEIDNLLRIAPADRKLDQLAKIRDHFRQQVCDDEQLVKHRDELAERRRRRDELEKSLPTTLIWKEMVTPKPAFILQRGAYDKPGEQVYRNTPAAFPPLPPLAEGETASRLHLAKWLVSPAHPLTARVTVNRIWQQYFGVGIVETSEDFGSQGTPPSHPALLDWLAVEFRESGWDVKQLHKSIVMSATYRQSSRLTPELAKADPRNRWLARGPRFRMDAEMIRDTALAISGLLVSDLGGPSVKPYQPEGIWEAVGYTDSDTAKFSRDAGQALYRRTLYSFWKRTAPPPTLVTLDAPSRESCTVRRSRTNTPLAALALMNDEQFVEASRGLGQRILREGGADDESRAKFAFRLATAREPGETELAVLLKVFRESLEKFRSKPESAAQLNAVGESKPDSELDACELAAWSMVGNLVLNLDETLTK
ncbi:MAG: DUF1553 domain-containing protein, partial [Planctomycetales bacterium]|nr:DUF1553 domain-containing protein [Planctomycetales bacterium]